MVIRRNEYLQYNEYKHNVHVISVIKVPILILCAKLVSTYFAQNNITIWDSHGNNVYLREWRERESGYCIHIINEVA